MPLNKARWPPFCAVEYDNDLGFTTKQFLSYQIGTHAALEGIICLNDVPCHRPFLDPEGETCICATMRAQEAQRQAQTFQSRAQQRQIRSGFKLDKKKLPCRHLLMGTCSIRTCGFLGTDRGSP